MLVTIFHSCQIKQFVFFIFTQFIFSTNDYYCVIKKDKMLFILKNIIIYRFYFLLLNRFLHLKFVDLFKSLLIDILMNYFLIDFKIYFEKYFSFLDFRFFFMNYFKCFELFFLIDIFCFFIRESYCLVD